MHGWVTRNNANAAAQDELLRWAAWKMAESVTMVTTDAELVLQWDNSPSITCNLQMKQSWDTNHIIWIQLNKNHVINCNPPRWTNKRPHNHTNRCTQYYETTHQWSTLTTSKQPSDSWEAWRARLIVPPHTHHTPSCQLTGHGHNLKQASARVIFIMMLPDQLLRRTIVF